MIKRLAILLAFALGALAQQQQPQTARKPDCQIFFTLTNSSLTSAFLDNRQVGCTTWAAAYTSSGFTGLTVTVQESLEQSNTPVTWATFTGTGNPATATDAAIIQLTGYPAWARVQISGLTGTGTVKGILFGFLAGSSSAAGGGGGTVTSVAMTGDGTVYNATVPGSPITTAGTLAPTLHTQTANKLFAGPTSGGALAPTFRSAVKADQVASTVYNDQANAGTSTMTLDMNQSTSSNAFRVPVKIGVTTTVDGAIGYDPFTGMLHAGQVSTDTMIPQFTATPANNDCTKWVVSGSNFKLGTAGAACVAGGTPAGSNNDIQVNNSGSFGGGRGTLDSNGYMGLAGGLSIGGTFSGAQQFIGLTSGASGWAVNDVAGTSILYLLPTTAGSTGQVLSDSGSTTCPTLDSSLGSPICHQTAWVAQSGGGAGGTGITGYSGTGVTFSGTLFFPYVGGLIANATESSVDLEAPNAGTISNFYIQLSVALGVGNTTVFTWRKNGADTAITCTITGASATTCNDLTHTLTVAQGDLLDVKAVTTGTVVSAPSCAFAAQFSIAASTVAWGNITGTLPNQTDLYLDLYGAAVPPSASWSWINQGSATNASNPAGGFSLKIPDNASLNWRWYSRTATLSSDFTLTTFFWPTTFQANTQLAGVYLINSAASDKAIGWEVLAQAAGAYKLRVEHILNTTTDGATVSNTSILTKDALLGLRIQRVSGTCTFYYSTSNGQSWVTQFSESCTTYTTPDTIGLGGVSVTSNAALYTNLDVVGYSFTTP